MLVQWKVDKLTSNQNDESRQSHVVRNQNASERILRANVADFLVRRSGTSVLRCKELVVFV